MAFRNLHHLDHGNIARQRLRLPEYRARVAVTAVADTFHERN